MDPVCVIRLCMGAKGSLQALQFEAAGVAKKNSPKLVPALTSGGMHLAPQVSERRDDPIFICHHQHCQYCRYFMRLARNRELGGWVYGK